MKILIFNHIFEIWALISNTFKHLIYMYFIERTSTIKNTLCEVIFLLALYFNSDEKKNESVRKNRNNLGKTHISTNC